MKKIMALFLFFLLFAFNVKANEKSEYLFSKIYINDNLNNTLSDDNLLTVEEITSNSKITIESLEQISNIYIIYSMDNSLGTLKTEYEEKRVGENKFLHELIEITPTNKIELKFDKNVKIKELYTFGTNLPNWVQKWNPPCEDADALLLSAHSDDEHIFFAGLIPYLLNDDKKVQVVYLTTHYKTSIRFDEMLDGLWTVGIRNYPINGNIVDMYSTSLDDAISNLGKTNSSLDDVINFEVDMIRRFKPEVVISHDENGEYGHGQHRLVTHALKESLKYLNDKNYTSVYQTFMPQKIYLHLYNENTITMDYDKPLKLYNGKSAFQVSMEGLSCHKSQLKIKWAKWINYTSVRQVTQYSPMYFGLYYSNVGYENEDGNMFYNIPEKEELISNSYIPEHVEQVLEVKNNIKNTGNDINDSKFIDVYRIIVLALFVLLFIADIFIIKNRIK